MRGNSRARRWVAALSCLAAACALPLPAALAADAPPRFDDGFGITVLDQPEWVDEHHRTFVLTVATDQVPGFAPIGRQVSGEHAILVVLPENYDPGVRYPVNYLLHGSPELPDSPRYQVLPERATEGVPLITVTPHGGGRGWYSNWVAPGASGVQNWESFHLDQVIPLIDANLSTIASREGRAISGHSMGGFGAFHYAEHRPELFGFVGSFSGDLDLLDPRMRGAVVGSALLPAAGLPLDPPDAVFGSPVWPGDAVWNEQSPAHHVEPLRGMGVAIYTGDGGDLLDDPVLAVAEAVVRDAAAVTSANLTAAGIAHRFADYGDGTGWGEGCDGKHARDACLQADLDDYVGLLAERLQHP
ncbi:alpha/beta hydrolase [Saccharopolyspora sp. MS10]|uniref:alpha/beta hydrolase n=1 Tax=Saccharopolyspora sp. MS10 TaxID=3385973 RepID=UPI0039A31FBF